MLTLIEACGSLDDVLGSFMTSWMSRRCALGAILLGRPLLGRFTAVFSPFVDNGFDHLRLFNSFQTDVNCLVCHLFLNFFR